MTVLIHAATDSIDEDKFIVFNIQFMGTFRAGYVEYFKAHVRKCIALENTRIYNLYLNVEGFKPDATVKRCFRWLAPA